MPSSPTAPNKDTKAFAIVLSCFFLSGLAALLYQTVWMRYFSIAFGTSELAVVTVLVAYMGGLAIGAAAIRPLLPKLSHPVRTYALLELAIAASAALVPTALKLLRSLQITLLGNLPELPDAAGPGKGLFYLAAGFLILTIPTSLMGATLPLLAKGVVHSSKQIGHRIGLLYGINTLGAIAGTLIAAFALVPAFGLSLTATTGIAVNIIAGLLGLAVAKQMRLPTHSSSPPSTSPSPVPTSPSPPLRLTQLILPLMLLSGAASFAYEVLWTRLLSQVVGGSLEAFATMLAGFLAGIALGALIASRLAGSARRAAFGLVIAQLGIALLSVLAFILIDQLPAWSLKATLAGWSTLHINAIASIIILLPATSCIGATFPFAVRVLTPHPDQAAPVSARVYSWNTFGAILGATAAGFFLLPTLGFEGLIRLLVTLNLTLATTAALIPLRKKRRLLLSTGIAVIIAFTILFQPNPPSSVLQAAALSGRQLSESDATLTFSAVGRSANVAIVESQGAFHLRTNGLPEAFLAPIGAANNNNTDSRFLGLLPALARPQAQSALVIGFGGGTLIEGIPPSVKSIDVIELEEQVIEANRFIAPRRRFDPLEDPRLNIVIGDARGALALTTKKWDIIISQPSHPWTAGASHLYTSEFMGEVENHLNPGGVFLQWISTDFVDAPLARSLVATVHQAFPLIQVFQFKNNLFILSSNQPLQLPDSLFDLARPDGSILHFSHWPGVQYVEDAAATLLMDTPQAMRFLGNHPPSTDNNNLLATRSPRLLNHPEHVLSNQPPALWNNYDAFLEDDASLIKSLSQNHRWSTGRLSWKLNEWQNDHTRTHALIDAIHENTSQAALIRATQALLQEDFGTALNEFLTVLETNPANSEAKLCAAYASFRLTPFDFQFPTLFPNQPPGSTVHQSQEQFYQLAESLSAEERIILEAVFAGNRRDWPRLRQLDPQLDSALTVRNPMITLLTDLRANAWLNTAASPNATLNQKREAAQKALSIIDHSLEAGIVNPGILSLRATAAAESGNNPAFISAIFALLGPLNQPPKSDSMRQNFQFRLQVAHDLLKKYFSPADYQNSRPLLESLAARINSQPPLPP
ncbi:MAG: fused MFS/spermidine synthase [Verrucomicrobiota bacterium]